MLATFSTMVGGVISDIYHAGERNAPMSCFSGAALFGTGLGPMIAGFIERRAHWRWIYYSQAIASAVFLVILAVFLKETRGSVLLSRKAKVLNRYYDKMEEAGYYGVVFNSNDLSEKDTVRRIRWKVKSDEERATLVKMITISCYRPFHLLLTEPVVFFFSLWVAFSWAILYLQLSTIPLVFSTNHGFNVEQSGAVFSGELTHHTTLTRKLLTEQPSQSAPSSLSSSASSKKRSQPDSAKCPAPQKVDSTSPVSNPS